MKTDQLFKSFPVPIRIWAAAVLMAGLGTGCEEGEEPSAGHTDNLVGDYTMEALTVEPGIPVREETITDWLSILPECSRDDIISFSAEGEVLLDQGAVKCDSLSDQTTTAYWVWEDDFNTLTFDGISYGVLQNDGSVLELSYTEYIPLTDADHTLYLRLKKYSP